MAAHRRRRRGRPRGRAAPRVVLHRPGGRLVRRRSAPPPRSPGRWSPNASSASPSWEPCFDRGTRPAHARHRRRRPGLRAARRPRLPGPVAVDLAADAARDGARGRRRPGLQRSRLSRASPPRSTPSPASGSSRTPCPARGRRSAARTTTRARWQAASAWPRERAVLEVSGGQAPQHLVNEFAAAIAAGRAEVVLLFGSEAISTIEHFAKAAETAGPTSPSTPTAAWRTAATGCGASMPGTWPRTGSSGAPSQYALIDNARRARLKQTREEYAAAMGALFAPFTRVAAANPHASAPSRAHRARARHPDRGEPADRRPVHPVHRRPGEGQPGRRRAAHVGGGRAAAGRARRPLGVPARPRRPARARPDGAGRPVARARPRSWPPGTPSRSRASRRTTSPPSTCTPASPRRCSTSATASGIAPDDPRGLTLTGGLPFFGGAGNNYSMHAIAETVQRARAHPGSFGFVGANGGIMSKYSAGVYSTTPAPWRPDSSADLQAEIDGWPAPGGGRATPTGGRPSRPTRSGTPATAGGPASSSAGWRPTGGGSSPRATSDPGLLDLLTSGEPVGHGCTRGRSAPGTG